MDKKLFLEKLSEVADWEIPKVQLDASQRVTLSKMRSLKTEQEDQELEDDDDADNNDQELLESINWDTTDPNYDPTYNPTFHPRITALKRATTCEDCGKSCPNGRQKEKNVYTTEEGHKVWRERCKTCQMTKDPFTGQFCLNGFNVTLKYRRYAEMSKGTVIKRGRPPKR